MNVEAILATRQNGDGGMLPDQPAPAGGPNRPFRTLPGAASILATQAVLGGMTAAASWGLAGAHAAAAAWIGTAIAMVNLLHMGRRFKAAMAAARQKPLYLGAAERFLFTALAFAVAITRLHLPFLPLLAGFACAQFGHLAGSRTHPDPA